MLQNKVLIQVIVTHHILEKVQGQIKEVSFNRNMSSNWIQRVPYERAMKTEIETKQILKMKHHLA